MTTATYQREQELSYILLVELLAHQFCYPVRWIETQDMILGDFKAQRLVEIGPGETLTHMTKITLNRKYQTFDAAHTLRRDLYSYKKNTRELYYEHEPVQQVSKPEPAQPKPVAVPAAAEKPAETQAVAQPAQPAPVAQAAAVQDAPVTAAEIIKVVVSSTLRKDAASVSDSNSIKELSGGRSTLQNEILGDLLNEFGKLPARAEDLPLEELSAGVQETFNGQMGKQSNGMIAKLIASKMPGSYTLGSARKYLQERWGLGSGRQDSVLILAALQQPSGRLDSEADAKGFFDGVAQLYAKNAGISLASAATSDSNSGGAGMVIDKASLELLQSEQRDLNKKLLEVYAKSLNTDLHAEHQLTRQLQANAATLLEQLDLWNSEHGDFYASGIKPMFNPLKVRKYDSYWNWAVQDLYALVYDILAGRVSVTDMDIENQVILIANRSTKKLLNAIKYMKLIFSTQKREVYQSVDEFLGMLIEKCTTALATAPAAMTVPINVGPLTIVDRLGNIEYSETPRLIERVPVLDVKGSFFGDVKSSKLMELEPPKMTYINEKALGSSYSSSPGGSTGRASPDRFDISSDMTASTTVATPPPEYGSHALPRPNDYIHLRKRTGSDWEFHQLYTNIYLSTLESATSWGMSFESKQILVTGAGAGSIGGEIVQRLLAGGAKVVVTTSRYNPQTTRHFQDLYTRYGARGSELVLVPFNQGSKRDVESLIRYIYNDQSGLGWDLDHIVPFAAISENGSEIDNIGSKSELAHRIMLTNLLRLLGEVKKQKEAHGFKTRPAQVILPLSPNHGTFGNDGLYSESKIALETLFTKWHSESWGEYLSLCGAIIGWTRGTALMRDNDLVSHGIEKTGIRTFSQQEMAFNILGLMMPLVLSLTELEPIIADLSGGMNSVAGLKELVTAIRKEINETSTIRKAIVQEQAVIDALTSGISATPSSPLMRRANIRFDFPQLPSYRAVLEPLSTYRKGMVDLDKVVVIAGFAEVGPLGNARTRWEIEAYGELSLEGCIELAWIMGLVKYQNKPINGKPYCGLIDTKTGQAIADEDVKAKYEQYITEHTGIRLIENRPLDGPHDHSKQFLQEVAVQEDLEPFETTLEAALDFEREHGDKVLVVRSPDSDTCTVQLKKGACIFVPKSTTGGRTVGGQIPTGWDPKTYGISDDIIDQVDRVTLYTLVATVEALLSAGITDPYELYHHIHVSEVGNMIGAGMGGLTSMDKMFKSRVLELPVQKDILQETFINTTAAWVNMLLMASSGPTVTPVAACATAIESLHVGTETILSGKAKMCLVGGCDDMSHTSRHEFRNMKATIDAEEDFGTGREAKEMSRPATTTRNGFVESEGAGVQVITTARLALDMGLPIHGVVAFTHTANDKNGRSVPAPGAGLLTSVVEAPGKFPSPLLSMPYRKRNLSIRLREIEEKKTLELAYLREQQRTQPNLNPAYVEEETQNIEDLAARQVKEALNTFGNSFWKGDSRIAPLRGALATWGLTIDDLNVASFHGTSTKKNEDNESRILHEQMAHLNRKEGNPLLGVFQKSLTGHPKGAAAAWMLNGCLQIMETGVVPGNRNADNIDANLAKYEHIVYPNRTIQTDGVNAFSVTSFGFGQKGGQAVGVHPKYLFATLEEEEYAAYEIKRKARHAKAYKHFQQGLTTNKVFVAKDHGPYPANKETEFLTNPHARIAV
ncbi:hypothetical protein F5884DRAFT_860078 [Xylogone sp. PMI_703]|nr:hypothetical protein F5884DRAFT_860078 [Xylogone sp. PMI_703]